MSDDRFQIKVTTGQIKNNCFIIMPFDGFFKAEYERVIKPAVLEAGLEPVRGDEIFSKPQIMEDIWKSIREARAVLAELTDKNANVFYELGLAHAIGKPAVIVTRNEADVPFDLKALRYVYYNTNDPFWGPNLRTAITDLLNRLLKEKQFGSGLEGIETFPQKSLPEVPTKPIKEIPQIPTNDISGVWKSTWISKMSSGGNLTHHVVMTVLQDGSGINGDLAVTMPLKGDVTVVHELLTGSIQDEDVFLKGVSYTIVQRGNVGKYNLDTFQLKLVSESQLTGILSSDVGRVSIEVTLEKISNTGGF